MTSTQHNPNDTFWLARYAYNQLAPLFTRAKDVEPTLIFAIEVTFADETTAHGGNHISVSSHWERDGMFQLSTWLRDRADVDRFVAKVAADVAALTAQVPA